MLRSNPIKSNWKKIKILKKELTKKITKHQLKKERKIQKNQFKKKRKNIGQIEKRLLLDLISKSRIPWNFWLIFNQQTYFLTNLILKDKLKILIKKPTKK